MIKNRRAFIVGIKSSTLSNKEITFLKKKYIKEEKTEYIKEFPIDGLDYPCNSYKEDLTFYFE